MKPEGVSRGVPEVYSNVSPGCRCGLLAYDAAALDMLRAAAAVGDVPSAAQQPDVIGALVLDADPIRPDKLSLLRFRLVLQEEGPHADPDARA